MIGSALICTSQYLHCTWVGARETTCVMRSLREKPDGKQDIHPCISQSSSAYQQILFDLFGLCPWNMFAPFSDCKFRYHSSISISWLMITFHFLSTSQPSVGLFILNGIFLNLSPATSIWNIRFPPNPLFPIHVPEYNPDVERPVWPMS